MSYKSKYTGSEIDNAANKILSNVNMDNVSLITPLNPDYSKVQLPNIDTTNKIIDFGYDAVITVGSNTTALMSTNSNYRAVSFANLGSGAINVCYNVETFNFTCRAHSATILQKEVVVGTMRFTQGGTNNFLDANFPFKFTIDGKAPIDAKSITSDMIADGGITRDKLANMSVTKINLASDIIDGSFPNMSVGQASSIIVPDKTEEFNLSLLYSNNSNKGDLKKIKSIKGNTFRLIQPIQNSNSDINKWNVTNGRITSIFNNSYLVIVNDVATPVTFQQNTTIPIGYYFICTKISTTLKSTPKLLLNGEEANQVAYNGVEDDNYYWWYVYISQDTSRIGFELSPSTPMLNVSSEYTFAINWSSIINFIYAPFSLDMFYDFFGIKYISNFLLTGCNKYTLGTIVNTNSGKINDKYPINIKDSVFPNGLNGIYCSYDQVTISKIQDEINQSQYIQRIGVIEDLTSLVWNSDDGLTFYASIENMAEIDENNLCTAFAICSGYTFYSPYMSGDTDVGAYITILETGDIGIYDPTVFGDMLTFQQKIAGMKLYYVLKNFKYTDNNTSVGYYIVGGNYDQYTTDNSPYSPVTLEINKVIKPNDLYFLTEHYVEATFVSETTLSLEDGDVTIPAHKPTKITGKLVSNTFNTKPLAWADLSHADTSHLTKLTAFFQYCRAGELNVQFDTSNVTSLDNTFMGCYGLHTIHGIGSWDTSKVTSMKWLFSDCYKLHTLGIASWDTSNVTSMRGTFTNCQAEMLDLRGWDCSKVKDTAYMFYHDTPSKTTTIRIGEGFGKMPGTPTVDFSTITTWIYDTGMMADLYDRKSHGLGTMTIKVSTETYAAMLCDTPSIVTTLTNKGYNIVYSGRELETTVKEAIVLSDDGLASDGDTCKMLKLNKNIFYVGDKLTVVGVKGYKSNGTTIDTADLILEVVSMALDSSTAAYHIVVRTLNGITLSTVKNVIPSIPKGTTIRLKTF
uniref:Uncharacterized protein n=1 Tax=Geladintestivirus 2 TaxID=3233134 RepID=A0AAU8MIL6_9CAUD